MRPGDWQPGLESYFYEYDTGRTRAWKRTACRSSKPVHFNLSPAALYEHAIRRQEGVLAQDGPLVCRTGAHTGRSPNDKFVVKEPSSEAQVWWGKVNKPIDAAHFDVLRRDIIAHLKGQELFVQDLYAGADPEYRLPVRFIQELAWQNLFVRNLFIVPPAADLAGLPAAVHRDDGADVQGGSGAARHALRRRHRVNLASREVLICGTSYAGENKKSIFTRAELPAAAARRAVDALLGEHRRGRRHGALLRPVRHRQDDAVERSRNAS